VTRTSNAMTLSVLLYPKHTIQVRGYAQNCPVICVRICTDLYVPDIFAYNLVPTILGSAGNRMVIGGVLPSKDCSFGLKKLWYVGGSGNLIPNRRKRTYSGGVDLSNISTSPLSPTVLRH
jgi:hypothetical protein